MSSEAYFRSQYEGMVKDNAVLKKTSEKLERENKDLKRSVYDLSVKVNVLQEQLGSLSKRQLFDLDSMLSKENESTDHSDDIHSTGTGGEDCKIFTYKSDLRGHSGAVYTAKFSPCGKLLASGSFDKTVGVWDVTTKSSNQQLSSLSDHSQLVIDVSWPADSTKLLSGSYDRTVKLWDIPSGKIVTSRQVLGLVQTVSFNPAENNIYFSGTSQKEIHMMDVRSAESSLWENDSMVNSLYVCHHGLQLITGDRNGMVKTWDVRMGRPVDDLCYVNDPFHNPISHLHVSLADVAAGDEDGRFIAVNSYDNVIRVYDRGLALLSHKQSQSSMKLVHFIKGHKNKNWPIKSCFYQGRGYAYNVQVPEVRRAVGDNDNDDDTGRVQLGARDSATSVHETMLLATGSADNRVYLFDVAGPKGSSQLLQRLDGHTDRVYGVDFHPREPILATASADFSIKVWIARNSNHRGSK